MKEMLKNAGILLAITLVAGFLLGFVYNMTKDTIAQRQLEDKMNAYKEVFSGADSFEAVDEFVNEDIRLNLDRAGFENEDIDELNKALDSSGNCLGYVMTITTHEGYGGDIVFTMGISNDGTMNGMSILEINETAGLGMNAEKVLKPQFSNKNVDLFAYSKTGAMAENEIDAISGATITTNAVTNGVNTGLYYFNTYLKEGTDNE